MTKFFLGAACGVALYAIVAVILTYLGAFSCG